MPVWTMPPDICTNQRAMPIAATTADATIPAMAPLPTLAGAFAGEPAGAAAAAAVVSVIVILLVVTDPWVPIG